MQIARRRKRHHAALNRLDDESGDIFRAQLGLQAREVAKRNQRAARQQRAEAFLEELVTDQRERPERDPVKAAVARDQPRPTRRRARELHRRVHGLGTGAGEEHGVEPARQTLRELFGQHAGQRRIVELHTIHEIRSKCGPQDVAHVGMVVTQTSEALTGMEVEISATRGIVEVGPLCRYVLLVEAEDPQHVDDR